MQRLFATLAALALLGATAAADKPHCRLERIDGTGLGDDRLRAYASVVELEGQYVDGLNPGQFVLRVDGKPAGRGQKVQSFAQTKEEVEVALVVEVAAQYRKVLDPVKEALRDFLADQPASMKVTLITFGSEVEKKTPRFLGAPMMSGELDDLSPDDDSVEVRMVDAINEALRQLKKLDPPKESGLPPPRRLIVLVSDGLNAKMDRATFKKMGEEALKAGVPIHSIAFSPIDERGPLLNLGEMSKRSHGTFRWAKNPDDFKEQLDTLADEVRKQYVITFKSSLSSTEKHSFSLLCGDLHSNAIGGAGGGESRGLHWYWWVVIGLAGALVVLFLIGLLIQAREKAAATPRQPKPVKAPKPAVAAQRPSGVMVAGQQRVAAQAAGGARARSATLIVVTGGLAGQRFPVSSALSVGKGQGHAIVIGDDPTVSTNHCELRPEGGGFMLRDLGSTNGTFVNGRRLAAPQWVNDGDLIRCGLNTQLKLRLD